MDNTEVVYLYLDDIIPNRFQPREIFDEQGLKELAVSIKEHGVIQPIIVRKVDNKYEIIAGERRYKASTMAGLTKIPAIVKNLDDKESSKVALIENLQRKDLSPIEEARTYQKILELEDNMTQEELAASVGKTQSSVSNKIRLLALPDEVQDALLNNKISERHARCLLNVENADDQVKLLSRITEEKLTVRELDKIVKGQDQEEVLEDKEEIPVVEVKKEESKEAEGALPSIPVVDSMAAEEAAPTLGETEGGKEDAPEDPEGPITTPEPMTEEVVGENGEIVTQEVGENKEETTTEEVKEEPKEEPAPTEEPPKEETPSEEPKQFDISNIENPFARKEVDEPMDQNPVSNNNMNTTPGVPGLNLNINPQAPTQMQPQMVPPVQMQPVSMPNQMQPQMIPQNPVVAPMPSANVPGPMTQPTGTVQPAAMPNQMVSAPASGAADSKAITEALNKMVEEYKSKGANIDFRSYNIGTVTSISITIR